MKKVSSLIIAVAVVVLFASTSFAEGIVKKNFGSCGLGTKWFGEKSGLIMHTLAGYTNGSTGIYGVTTGTSGCEKFQGFVFNTKVENFVASNLDNLANDMAKGNGEYLNTLAVIMEVSEVNRASFFTKLQENFSNIYTSDKVTAKEVVNNISKFI